MGVPKEKKKFRVGDKSKGADFSPEEIELLKYKLAKWFSDPLCDRQYPNPLETAAEIIEQCLLAKTKDGSRWRNAPDTFEQRIKIKALFDMETGKGRAAPTVKHPMAVSKQNPEAEAAAKEVKKTHSVMSVDEQDQIKKKKIKEIINVFPELSGPVYSSDVERLATYRVQQEILMRELSLNPNANQRSNLLDNLRKLEEMMDRTMTLLAIHPNQLAKRVDESKKGTLGELVATLDGDPEFKKREKLWALQLAYQLWWMSQHYNGKEDGPQVEAWEIWHMTRTKPFDFTCSCGKQYKNLVDGFEPHELKEYLLRNGMKLSTSALPQYLSEVDLVGIDDGLLSEEPESILPPEPNEKVEFITEKED